jgi:hypothetical protein
MPSTPAHLRNEIIGACVPITLGPVTLTNGDAGAKRAQVRVPTAMRVQEITWSCCAALATDVMTFSVQNVGQTGSTGTGVTTQALHSTGPLVNGAAIDLITVDGNEYGAIMVSGTTNVLRTANRDLAANDHLALFVTRTGAADSGIANLTVVVWCILSDQVQLAPADR